MKLILHLTRNEIYISFLFLTGKFYGEVNFM